MLAPIVQGQAFPEDLPLHYIREYTRIAVYSDLLRVSHSGVFGDRVFKRVRRERDTVADDWTVSTESHSVSYAITSLATREGGDVLFLAGMEDSGQTLVEQWTFADVPGRRGVRYTGSERVLGTPLPAYHPSVVIIGQPQGPPPIHRGPEKRQVFDGGRDPIMAIGADPEGGFLLIYTSNPKRVLRLWKGSSQADVLYSGPRLLPGIIDGVSSIQAAEFPGEGRKFLFRQLISPAPLSSDVLAILHDSNNDGVFEEPPTVLGYPAFVASQYGDWDDWDFFWSIDD